MAHLADKTNAEPMLSTLAVSGHVLPPPMLAGGSKSQSGVPTGFASTRLAKLAAAQVGARMKLKEQRQRFDQLYARAEHADVTPDDLNELAQALRARELEHAAILVPQIEQLDRNLSNPTGQSNAPAIRSWRRVAETSREIAIDWLELYQNLQIRLHKLASDRRSESDPASPVFTDADAAIGYLRGCAS